MILDKILIAAVAVLSLLAGSQAVNETDMLGNGTLRPLPGDSFSTTSADYWETTQTSREADDITDDILVDLQDVDGNQSVGDTIVWDGDSWAHEATSTFGGGGSSPWNADTNGINYTAGNVGIGTSSSSVSPLTVRTSGDYGARIEGETADDAWDIYVDTSGNLTFEDEDGNVQMELGDWSAGPLWLSEGIQHAGDADTTIIFGSDSIRFDTGGIQMLRLIESTDDTFWVNAGAADVDFKVEADTVTAIETDGATGTTTLGAGLAVPYLASCDTIDTDASGIFSCGTDDGGSSVWSEDTYGITYADHVGVATSSQNTAPLTVQSEINGTYEAIRILEPVGDNDHIDIWTSAGGSLNFTDDDGNSLLAIDDGSQADIGVRDQIYGFGDTNTYIDWNNGGDKITQYAGGVEIWAGIENVTNEFVVNDGGVDVDFRVESTGVADALVVDGADGGVTIGALANCDTIDADADGLLSCGTDGGGGSGLSTSTAIADTYVIYGTAVDTVGGESDFVYDDATDRLTLVNASSTNLTVSGGVDLMGDYITDITGTGLVLSSNTLALDTSYLNNNYIQVGTTSVASITTLENLSISESQISDLNHYTDADVSTYLTGGTGITESSGTISFDCSEVEGTGIDCTDEAITLDATGDWTGTLDTKNASDFILVGTTSVDSITTLSNLSITESQISDLGSYLTAVNWGDIGGTLSSQADLQTALDGKISVGTTSVGSITTLGNLSLPAGQVTGLDYYTDADVSTYLTGGTGINEVSGTLSIDFNDFDTDSITQGSTNLYNQSHTGEVTGATALTIASGVVDSDNITNNTIVASDLSTTTVFLDGEYLKYVAATDNFTSVTCAELTGSADLCDGSDDGGGSGDPAWATTTSGSDILLYPEDSDVDVLFGSNATATAGFWFDYSASTTHIGNGGAGDSFIKLAIDSVSKWVFGADDDDSDKFVISSGDTLGTNNMVEISTTEVTIPNASSTFLTVGTNSWLGTILSGVWNGTAIDFSSYTNATGGRSITLNGDAIDVDAELYTDTKCIYFEDPTASDDFNSIWRNSSASNYTMTEMWCESDQTVNLDLQIDDGTPADVNGSDLSCTSSEAEDTSLSGDTTLATNEELDLAITSVSGTPTWVSVCWTYTKND